MFLRILRVILWLMVSWKSVSTVSEYFLILDWCWFSRDDTNKYLQMHLMHYLWHIYWSCIFNLFLILPHHTYLFCLLAVECSRERRLCFWVAYNVIKTAPLRLCRPPIYPYAPDLYCAPNTLPDLHSTSCSLLCILSNWCDASCLLFQPSMTHADSCAPFLPFPLDYLCLVQCLSHTPCTGPLECSF